MCLCTCKVQASGKKTGLESKLASLTSIFKIVLAGLLYLSFNKSYMRLFNKKQKKDYIYLLLPVATTKKITALAIKDRAKYRPKAIRNPTGSGRYWSPLTKSRTKHYTLNPIEAIQMTS